MSDSLYQKLIILNSKTDALNSKIDKLSDKSALSLWAPIIAALITAIIGTLLAQAIDRLFKNRQEKTKDLREIHSTCVNIKIKLKDLFRQLAMYKFHAQFWWHIHSKENNPDFRNKYYLEHLRSQTEARDTEKQIGIVKADFLAEVIKFERLKGKKFNVESEKATIENIAFRKAKTYPENLDADKLREELAEQDERELREIYFINLQPFQNIINSMNLGPRPT